MRWRRRKRKRRKKDKDKKKEKKKKIKKKNEKTMVLSESDARRRSDKMNPNKFRAVAQASTHHLIPLRPVFQSRPVHVAFVH
jgi:hypothetical protein